MHNKDTTNGGNGQHKAKYAPVLIWATRTGRFFRPRVQQRDNPEHRNWLARQHEKTMRDQGIYKYAVIPDSEYKRYSRYLRNHGFWHRSFPTPGGTVIVASDNSGLPELGYLPLDADDIVTLIDGWIAEIPSGRRVGGTHNSAGKRAKPPKGEFVRVYGNAQEFAAAFRARLPELRETLDPDDYELLVESLYHAHRPNFYLDGLTGEQIRQVLEDANLIDDGEPPITWEGWAWSGISQTKDVI